MRISSLPGDPGTAPAEGYNGALVYLNGVLQSRVVTADDVLGIVILDDPQGTPTLVGASPACPHCGRPAVAGTWRRLTTLRGWVQIVPPAP